MNKNETTKLMCPYCHGTGHITQAGWNKTGSKRARCEECQRYFTAHKKPMGYSAELRTQAIQMHLEGLSFRGVGRALGVNFQSVINWFSQAHDALPHHVEDQTPAQTVEIDELFTYVGKKRNKRT